MEMIFKIAIFGHETSGWSIFGHATCPLAKVPEVAHFTPFLFQWVKIELIFTLQAAVSDIRADFKIALFGHEIWPLSKVPEVAHILDKLPASPKFHPVLLYDRLFSR